MPLIFLAISAVLNIALDLIFVLVFSWGIAGVAWATVIAQYISAVGLCLYVLFKCPELIPKHGDMRFSKPILKDIFSLSSLTCLQQSVMNFGILMVQGLVNSFGATVMAAFAAAVKIDTFAYLPVQDFGNAYSTFVAQNHGAGDHGRIRAGTKQAFIISTAFSVAISALVFAFARPLMLIFIDANETAVLLAGIKYLRILEIGSNVRSRHRYHHAVKTRILDIAHDLRDLVADSLVDSAASVICHMNRLSLCCPTEKPPQRNTARYAFPGFPGAASRVALKSDGVLFPVGDDLIKCVSVVFRNCRNFAPG